MKILYLVDDFPSISTPFILNHITGMIDKGHEVRIFSRLKGKMEPLHPAVIKYDLLSKTDYFIPMETTFVKRVFSYLPLMFSLLFTAPSAFFEAINFVKHGKFAVSLRYFVEVYSAAKLKEKEFDVIHAQFGTLGMIAARMREAKLIHGKLITHFRGFDLSLIISYYKNPNYYKYLFERGDVFLANCQFFLNKMIDIGAPKDRSFVNYSGIKINDFPTERIIPHRNEGIVRLGTVGRLTAKKGFPYIFEALAILKNITPTTPFVYEIVGDGPDYEMLKEKVNALGLADCVKFHGAQNHSYIAKFLGSIDIFLSHNVTSEKGDQDAPVNTIKEAFLCKLPVVSTLHGGIPELVKHEQNGLLSPEKDSNAFAENILKLIQNEELCMKFGEEGRQYVITHFAHDKLIDQLEGYYLKTLH